LENIGIYRDGVDSTVKFHVLQIDKDVEAAEKRRIFDHAGNRKQSPFSPSRYTG
jgi:hypothetical protein